ncbi:MAG: carboxypeptidase regulatory-like domain-containing protein [Myxococcales bacterium]|nr:carboxypeptidase regulatory-like domain-containing protein [Myxococcales bacterium]
MKRSKSTAALLLLMFGCLDTGLPGAMSPGTVRATVVIAIPGRSELVPAAGVSLELLGTALEATSDSEGMVVLSGIEVSRGDLLFSLDADADGTVDRSRVLTLQAARAGRGRGDVNLGLIVLSRNATLSGRVLLGDRSALPTGHAGTDVVLVGLSQTARTGDDGSFVLAGVPEGELVVEATRAGYGPEALVVTAGAGEDKRLATVTLRPITGSQPVGRLSGLVLLEDQTPIAAANIRAIGGVEQRASTDPSGRFTFALLPTGTYALELSKPGFAPRTVPGITVPAGVLEVGPYTLVPIVDGGAGGGSAGGTSGGTAGGTAGGASGGTAGGASGGTAGGASGGTAGGASGGTAGGASGGTAGGASGGTAGGASGGTAGGGAVGTPPVVALMASSSTLVADGTITFTVTATDDVGVTRVEFFEGLSLVSTATVPMGTNQYPFFRMFTSTNNGTRQFVARAFDGAGNVSTSNTVIVNVSIPVPSAPLELGYINGCRLLLKADGSVLTSSGVGSGYGPCTLLTTPTFLAGPGLSGISAFNSFSTAEYALFVRTTGEVLCSGGGVVCGTAPTAPPGVGLVVGITDAVSVGMGRFSATCATRTNGTAACWGFSGYMGSAGPASATPRTVTFTDGGVFTGATRVFGCNSGNTILRSDGTLWSFGRNDFSTPLGIGFAANFTQFFPLPVVTSNGQPLQNVIDFACGPDQHIALTSDAGAFAYGLVTRGTEFGNPAIAPGRYDFAVPAATGLSNLVDVECGTEHTVAVDSNGVVWTWGQNQQGMLGNNSRMASAVPVQVLGLPPIRRVGAGGNTSLAIANDGRLFAWGEARTSGIADAGTELLTPRLVQVP